MSIQLKWLDHDETILLEVFEAKWSVDDYIQMVDQAANLISKKDYVVDVIGDFSGTSTMPSGNTMVALRHADKKAPKNQGHVAFVKPGTFINVLLGIAKSAKLSAATQVHVCNSVQEAVELLKSLRQRSTTSDSR